VLKVIRRIQLLANLDSLTLMAHGIINSTAPLFWAILILILIMYAFGLFLMSGLSGSMYDMDYPLADTDLEKVNVIDIKFGSVYRTIASLFEGVSGGDWPGITREMRIFSEGLYVCFALYIVFVTLGVFNIVTGSFVEGTMEATVTAREEMLQHAQEKKSAMVQLVGDFFTRLDTNNSGTLSFDELESDLEDEALQEYFCVLEMEPSEAKVLFNLLDIRKEGEVSISDFTTGCLKIMGAPKNIDICTCICQGKRTEALLEHVANTLTAMQQSLSSE